MKTKNLARQAATKGGLQAREATPTSADIKGLLITFVAKSELKGLKKRTIESRLNTLKLLIKRGVNLLDGASVFKAIDNAKKFDHATKQLTEESWSDGTKHNAAQAYRSFCEIKDIAIPKHVNFDKWTRQPQKLPWVRLEREVDALIAGCSKRTAAFLQDPQRNGYALWRSVAAEMDRRRHRTRRLNPCDA